MAEPQDCMKASYCRHRDGADRFDQVVAAMTGAWWTDDQAAVLLALVRQSTAHLASTNLAGVPIRTLAASRIVDLWIGGKDWRTKLEDTDFLESADWIAALSYADAVLSIFGDQPETPQP